MRHRPIVIVAATATLAVSLAACGSSQPAPTKTPMSTTPAATASTASAADVAFAQLMIPHHEQAVQMADAALASAADASPQVTRLAEQIKAAQDPEITQMQQWLTQWGAPSMMPSGSPSGHGMPGHDMGGMTSSGMMTPEQMQQMMGLSGPEFDRMWQEMMIAHHEGAITMAQQALQTSTNPEVRELAQAIIAAQQDEITTMRTNLTS